MDKCREAYEKSVRELWAKRNINFDKFDWLENEQRYKSDHTQFKWEVWQSRQVEIDQQKLLTLDSEIHLDVAKEEIERLKGVLDERTKEWLEAIKLGTYFQDIAKPLKDELGEKDKQIEELQAKVDAVEHVLGCAMIAPKEVFQYADRIGKALRGEQ